MKLGLINSAWVQANQPTVFGLRKTKEIGFDTVDIFVDPLDIDVRERRLIKDECDRLDLPIVSIACVAVGLIDFNPSVQRFHIDRCVRISTWPTSTRRRTCCWCSASTSGTRK